MSVARTRHVLNAIDHYRDDHHQTITIAAAGLAVAALVLAVRSGSLAGAALLIAVVAIGVIATLWFRLRAVERSHAALLRTVAELTSRLDQPPVPVVASVGAPAGVTVTIAAADEGMPAAEVGADAVGVEGPSEPRPIAVADVDEPDAPAAGSIANDELAASGDDAVTLAGDRTIAGQGTAPDEAGHLADAPDQEPSPPVETPVLEMIPAFALTSLKGETVTGADLVGTPAVVVFWRPGCPHCQRLTPELVAWESLQGPRLVVFAACDGPTAYRAGLPGLVILDPGFTVGQAAGAPGTPAALPIDAAARPSGPIVAGASAVTALLRDAMRDWASVEVEPMPRLPAMTVDGVEASVAGPTGIGTTNEATTTRPAVLLRRVEEPVSDDALIAPDWDAESVTRRAG